MYRCTHVCACVIAKSLTLDNHNVSVLNTINYYYPFLMGKPMLPSIHHMQLFSLLQP